MTKRKITFPRGEHIVERSHGKHVLSDRWVRAGVVLGLAAIGSFVTVVGAHYETGFVSELALATVWALFLLLEVTKNFAHATAQALVFSVAFTALYPITHNTTFTATPVLLLLACVALACMGWVAYAATDCVRANRARL